MTPEELEPIDATTPVVAHNPIASAYAPKPGKADQRVYTSVEFVEQLILPMWPEGIAYDPFPGAMAPVTALAARSCPYPTLDGFEEPLADRTFGNPPFKHMQRAMPKFQQHARGFGHEDDRLMLLGPANTHRDWFWSNCGQAIAWLKQIKFHGWSFTFPKPLCVTYYGPDAARFVEVARGARLKGAKGRTFPLALRAELVTP